jgi:hypothetical protein
MAPKRIGELLLDRGAINREQLTAGLAAQQASGQRLGATLIQMGAISEVQLAQVLAQSLGLATVDLNQVQVDWSAVHMLRAHFCESHELFPFAVDGKGTDHKRVMVAMSDPLNQPALQEIEFTTGLPVAAYVSTHTQIRTAILRYYHKIADAPAKGAGPTFGPPAGQPRLEPVELEPELEDEPPMVVGEEIISRPAETPTGAAARSQAVARDLDFLFGARPGPDDLEKLERKFWALMKLLSRKGIVGREEFLKELEDTEG